MFTIAEVSKITGKNENLIRQHIHRKHLEASKTENGTLINKEELLSWAKSRNIKIDEEILSSLETFTPDTTNITSKLSSKSTRCKILLLKNGDETIFLACSIKIRSAAKSVKEKDWSEIDTENKEIILLQKDTNGEWDLKSYLSSLFSGIKILNYEFKANALDEKHTYLGPENENNLSSPFLCSAHLTEYWNYNLDFKKSISDELNNEKYKKDMSRFDVNLNTSPERVGNVLIFEAIDTLRVDINKTTDTNLRIKLNKKPDTPVSIVIKCWLNEELIYKNLRYISEKIIDIDIKQYFNRFSYDIFNNDGTPITDSDNYIMESIGLNINAIGRSISIKDKTGEKIATINKGFNQESQISFFSNSEKLKEFKNISLWGKLKAKQYKLKNKKSMFEFETGERDRFLQEVINQIMDFSMHNETVYFCDPYFLRFLHSEKGSLFFIKLAEALSGRKLRILCGHLSDIPTSKIFEKLEEKCNTNIFSGIEIKVISADVNSEIKNVMHNRWIAKKDSYYTISNSLNSVNEDGAVMHKADSQYYFTTSEYFWSIQEDNINFKILTKSF